MDGRVSSPPRVKRCPFSVDQRCAFFHRRAEVSSSVSCRVVPVEFCLSNARSSGFEKSHDTTFFKNFRLLSEGAGHTSQRPARRVASVVSSARVDPRGRKSLSARVLASRPADSGVRSPPISARRPERQRDSQRAIAPRRSARARGPAADVEMPAAEPEVADAADPSAPSAHKSILKKTPSARAPTPSEEHEDEDHFDALFGALCPRTPRSRWWSRTGAPSTPRTPRARSRSCTRSSPGCVSRSPRGSPPIRPAPRARLERDV